jgi:hypothetical protein
MTILSSHIAVGYVSTSTDVARRTAEVVLAIAIVAALTGAWLAFFSFVPFDLTPHW